MNLDFLKHVKIDEEELNKRAPRTVGAHRKDWNPTYPNSIRLWKDGSVFPSADLVERFSLEYVDRPADDTAEPGAEPTVDKKPKWEQPGNALDIMDSDEFPVFKAPRRFILANVVAKAAGKADLFASGDWEKGTGKSNSSVMEQGAHTFGKATMIAMVKDVYGIELNEQTPYVDLIFLGKDGEKLGPAAHFSLPGEKKVCFVPKKVSRGDTKGQGTVARREDPWLYILVPLIELHPELVSYETKAKKEKKEGAQLQVDDLLPFKEEVK